MNNDGILTGEQLFLIEHNISSYAFEVFKSNNVPPIIARLIIGNVCREIQDLIINDTLLPKQEIATREIKKGTVDDLLNDMKTCFKVNTDKETNNGDSE